MQAIIKPSHIKGSVTPPASKSMMQRICAGALLHNGRTIIRNPGNSDDDRVALNIVKELGAKVGKQPDGSIEIISDGKVHPPSSIDCGESGLSARMFTPIVALSDRQVTVNGSGSLLVRPMNILHDILPALGVNLPGFNSYLPVTVHGPLQAKSIAIDASLSSQYLTGLLFALTAAATTPITIEVTELNSKPYIDLTLDVLRQFGKVVTNNDYRQFKIDPPSFTYSGEVVVHNETDWSSAAFWLTAAAINGSVSVKSLSMDSTQADKAIIDILRQAGAEVNETEGNVEVSSPEQLRAFNYDTTQSPDLFPILAILAACCEGTSEIKGLSRLTHKESNRTESIGDMLQQFGIEYEVAVDSMLIRGKRHLKGTTVDSCQDHRIAMAGAIGALRADGPVTINNAEAVSKSYRDFFDHLASLGVSVEIKG